jgi:hypothetical protein
VPRVYASLHPDPLVNTQGKINMDGKMLTTFLSSLFGFSVLAFWMFRIKLQLIKLKLKIKNME